MNKWLICLFGLASVACTAAAETAEQKGTRLATDWLGRTAGYRWMSSKGQMTLVDAAGQRNARHFTSRMLEGLPGEDKVILVFTFPPDVAGTTLLTQGQTAGQGYHWVYLPKLQRALRVAGTQKTSNFLGSEFSYEDLSAPVLNNYRLSGLPDEPCPDLAQLFCYKIERHPIALDSGYTKIIDWVDQDAYRLRQSEFYDRNGLLFKRLTAEDFKQYNEHIWRPMRLTMRNLRTQKTTEIQWLAHDFETPLNDAEFSVKAMEKRP